MMHKTWKCSWWCVALSSKPLVLQRWTDEVLLSHQLMINISAVCLSSSAPARNQAFDVVLVDTAGRMQDNAPLMTALAKLIAVNMPDLVLFVGEALVGNEAVDQLVRTLLT